MKTPSIGIAIGCAAAICALSGQVTAQAPDGVGSVAGYHVGENATPDNANLGAKKAIGSDTAGSGPIRMARFSYVSGDITWRPADSAQWSPASVNLPARQGAQFWANGNDRAELQFDDGSYVRLGADAVVTLQTLYSDLHGEFTELRLSQGLITMHLINRDSVFQIDTPDASVKASGRSKVRVGVDAGTEVAVRYGRATIEDDQDQTTLRAGDYVNISDPSASFSVGALPPKDSWDLFCDERDQIMSRSAAHLSPQLALCAGDLESYGTWRDDSTYGTVWVPSAVQAGWRPYHDGHWVWVEPFGWTWVSNEPWGWAPYHYGTWFHAAYGWAWCPGPSVQYWSPGVVQFVSYGDDVCWAPLCPSEVHFPSPFDCYGTSGQGWYSTYAIGACAVYTPVDDCYCEPRRWRNTTANCVTKIYDPPYIVNSNRRITSPIGAVHFVPQNCRSGYGASEVKSANFGRRGGYQNVAAASTAGLFSHGRPIVAGQAGSDPIAGPVMVRPSPGSYSPRAAVTADTAARRTVFERPVLRTQVPVNIARTSAPVTGVIRPVRPTGDDTSGRRQPEGAGWNPGRPNGAGRQQGNTDNASVATIRRPTVNDGNGGIAPRPQPKNDPAPAQDGTLTIWGRPREHREHPDPQPSIQPVPDLTPASDPAPASVEPARSPDPVWTAPQRDDPPAREPDPVRVERRDPDPPPAQTQRPEPSRNDDQSDRNNGRQGGGVFGRPR